MERFTFDFPDDDVKDVSFVLPSEHELVLLYDPELAGSLADASGGGSDAVRRVLHQGWTIGYMDAQTFWHAYVGESLTPTHWARLPEVEPSRLVSEYITLKQETQPE